MNVLVIDVGGSNVKMLATGQSKMRKFKSGAEMTAATMAERVKELARGWDYEAVAIGYPGAVVHDQPVAEPHNLASGWVKFDYREAFGCPVKMVNDAAMQALGSYKQGKLLFLGLGTGLGSALVVDGVLVAMELAHLPYGDGSFEDYVGERALDRDGKKKWRKSVADVVARLQAAFVAEDVVIGGGNVRFLKELPAGCRAGKNANAFTGGFRLWAKAQGAPREAAAKKPGVAKAPRKTGPAKKAAPKVAPKATRKATPRATLRPRGARPKAAPSAS